MISTIAMPSVKQFMDTFEQKRYEMLSFVPSRVLEFRISLIEEEEKEYITAVKTADILDALCDLMYVVAGAALTCGIGISHNGDWDMVSLTPKPDLSNAMGDIISEMRTPVPCQRRLTDDLYRGLKRILDIGMSYTNQFSAAFEEVHKANMTKIWNERPTDENLIVSIKGDKFLVRNRQGKIIKPSTFSPPKLEQFL